jgi:hypothetical protein
MVNVSIVYDHLVYFMAIWYNLCPFGIVCGQWSFVIFFTNLVCLGQDKSGNPDSIYGSLRGFLPSRFFLCPLKRNVFSVFFFSSGCRAD